jgi:hypothetical protein
VGINKLGETTVLGWGIQPKTRLFLGISTPNLLLLTSLGNEEYAPDSG